MFLIEDSEDDVRIIRGMFLENKEIVMDLDYADRLSVGLTNLTESWCQLGAKHTHPTVLS